MNEKIALTIMYDGSRFHGWQVQKNAPSVQGALQEALFELLGFYPDISGCSRTDAGVHANSYVCHLPKDNINIHDEKLPLAINAHLRNIPISVKSAVTLGEDFHARYSCTGKEYIYKIWNAPYDNPFLSGKALFFPKRLNFEENAFLFDEFCGKHDFRAFMTKGSKNEDNTVRTIKYFDFERRDELITLRVCADGFLYNMVRIMTGTLLELCCGNTASPGDVSSVIYSKERKNAGDTAPAHALYLNRVFYPQNTFKKD